MKPFIIKFRKKRYFPGVFEGLQKLLENACSQKFVKIFLEWHKYNFPFLKKKFIPSLFSPFFLRYVFEFKVLLQFSISCCKLDCSINCVSKV